MLYALFGFCCGFVIPNLARKFSKFMPATLAYALYRIFAVPQQVAWEKRKNNPGYLLLWKKIVRRAVMYGIGCAVLFAAAPLVWGDSFSWLYLLFIWLLLLAAEIDIRMLLLPDILTVPLLIAGFAVAAGGTGFINAEMSAGGALVGYFLPVIVSLLFVWKNKDAFGGGDIKLLAAIGAWLGVEPLLYVIVTASVLFSLGALIKRQSVGAFGPSIAAAGIMIAFLVF